MASESRVCELPQLHNIRVLAIEFSSIIIGLEFSCPVLAKKATIQIRKRISMERRSISMPVGIVVRKTPGVTRWAKWAWKAVAVLPGAGPADWRELRREGDAVEYHAGTLPLELFRTDTDAYIAALENDPPSVYVIMRPSENSDRELELLLITASAFEAQDYQDSSEEVVEPVPMPAGLIAWVREWVEFHHVEEKFIKRRRDKKNIDMADDGIGDERIRQTADVYRSPGSKKRTLQ